MSIPLTCSACARKLKVRDEAAGKSIKCPGCGRPLRVPGAASAAVPLPPSPPASQAAARSEPPPSSPAAPAAKPRKGRKRRRLDSGTGFALEYPDASMFAWERSDDGKIEIVKQPADLYECLGPRPGAPWQCKGELEMHKPGTSHFRGEHGLTVDFEHWI